jgi:mRNA interferase RelE/StbE
MKQNIKYELVYGKRAVKDIERLNPSVKNRIGVALIRFRENPLKYSSKLTNSPLGGYRFRIGDYRVIFDLVGDQIVILRVGDRKDIYKRK